jgi:hypothetical protein
VCFDVGHDRIDQAGHVREGAAPDAFVGDFAEPTFDEVEPRSAGRNEVQMEAEKRFRRIKGYRELPLLLNALEQLVDSEEAVA